MACVRAQNNMDVWVETHQRLRWLHGLVGRLHALSAGALWSTVALMVLGQLALLVTLFLPFQVMFMLATRQVSRYLAWVGEWLPFNALVLVLVVATLVLYGLHLLCGRGARAQVAVMATQVLRHGNKLALFRDDRQQARDVVQRLASWCVAGLLAVVYAALGMWVDAPMFGAVLGVAGLSFVGLQALLRQPVNGVARAFKWAQTRRVRASAIWANSLFFLGFLVLFAQFLRAGGDMLTAILALLLLRQMTAWLSLWALGVVSLPVGRARVDALFDPQQHYAPRPAAALNTFLDQLAPSARDLWLPAVIEQVTGERPLGQLSCHWTDTGFMGLAAYDVDPADPIPQAAAGTGRHAYFVRCFAQPLRQHADHEARLFECATTPPLAPHYLGRTQVGDASVLVFEGLPRRRPTAAELPALRKQCHQACAELALDATLISAYLRSHPTLPHRLDATLIARLRVAAASAAQRDDLDRFEEVLAPLRQRLLDLPCVLENPDTASAFMRVDDGGRPLVWQWQRWKADQVHPHLPWATPAVRLGQHPVGPGARRPQRPPWRGPGQAARGAAGVGGLRNKRRC